MTSLDPAPDAPQLTGLAVSAVAQHELFLAYREAGFTETQALVLVAEFVAASCRRQQ
jgi:hypothetical protein